LVTNC